MSFKSTWMQRRKSKFLQLESTIHPDETKKVDWQMDRRRKSCWKALFADLVLFVRQRKIFEGIYCWKKSYLTTPLSRIQVGNHPAPAATVYVRSTGYDFHY